MCPGRSAAEPKKKQHRNKKRPILCMYVMPPASPWVTFLFFLPFFLVLIPYVSRSSATSSFPFPLRVLVFRRFLLCSAFRVVTYYVISSVSSYFPLVLAVVFGGIVVVVIVVTIAVVIGVFVFFVVVFLLALSSRLWLLVMSVLVVLRLLSRLVLVIFSSSSALQLPVAFYLPFMCSKRYLLDKWARSRN